MADLTHAMDVARGRQVAGDLEKAKADLQQALEQANGAIHKMGANWRGQDQTQFEHSWGKTQQLITQQIQDIQHMAKTLNQNADLQEKTSQG
ncbi:MAG TPA: WXG100 family type VII secretion target [Segeticoccus sp.]|nr:WXG100 family type VII secretion target [Segeticoccus sp.]